MRKRAKAGIALGCAILAGVIAYGHLLKCVRYEVRTSKIGAPVKIAFLSDVHNSLYGNGQKELVENIGRFGADLVVFGGDLFDSTDGQSNSWALVDALASRYDCFYAVGNHEQRVGAARFTDQMRQRGVTVLSGETTTVTANGQKLRICGADGLYDGTMEAAREQLDGTYSVLIYHFPEDFPKTSGMGFDLILAGHAHGGQWRIPGILNGLYSPGEGLFPKYGGGRYEAENTVMLVSRGLYRHLDCIVTPRIFNNPELLLITVAPC